MANVWREAFATFVRRHPITAPTQEVYQKGTITQPLGKLWPIGAAVIIAVLAVGIIIPELARYTVYLALSVLPVIILLAWLLSTDRYEPEPKTLILAVIGIGVLASAFSNIIPFPPGLPFYLLKLVALEFVFLLVLYLIDANRFTGREFNDHLDGAVYGLSLGLGYILYNNFYLLGGYAEIRPEFLVSLALEEFVYVMFPAFTGWWVGYVKAKYVSVGFGQVFAGFVPVAILKVLAAAVITFFATQIFPLRLVGTGLVTALLLVLLLRRVSWALADELAWGYATGKAPVEKSTG
ncbi:MAG: hypothetical protein N3H84_04190 [Candidatus Caldarchaeum sp.]|nr:hypothetical protein [Candidatus Caldarchaeum sp.]